MWLSALTCPMALVGSLERVAAAFLRFASRSSTMSPTARRMLTLTSLRLALMVPRMLWSQSSPYTSDHKLRNSHTSRRPAPRYWIAAARSLRRGVPDSKPTWSDIAAMLCQQVEGLCRHLELDRCANGTQQCLCGYWQKLRARSEADDLDGMIECGLQSIICTVTVCKIKMDAEVPPEQCRFCLQVASGNHVKRVGSLVRLGSARMCCR